MKRYLALTALLCTTLAACADPNYRRDYEGGKTRSDVRSDWQGRHLDKLQEKARYYFDQADTNDDGLISRGEHRAFGDRMFREADTDRNGRLTFEEVLAQKHREMDEFKDYKRNR